MAAGFRTGQRCCMLTGRAADHGQSGIGRSDASFHHVLDSACRRGLSSRNATGPAFGSGRGSIPPRPHHRGRPRRLRMSRRRGSGLSLPPGVGRSPAPPVKAATARQFRRAAQGPQRRGNGSPVACPRRGPGPPVYSPRHRRDLAGRGRFAAQAQWPGSVRPPPTAVGPSTSTSGPLTRTTTGPCGCMRHGDHNCSISPPSRSTIPVGQVAIRGESRQPTATCCPATPLACSRMNLRPQFATQLFAQRLEGRGMVGIPPQRLDRGAGLSVRSSITVSSRSPAPRSGPLPDGLRPLRVQRSIDLPLTQGARPRPMQTV